MRAHLKHSLYLAPRGSQPVTVLDGHFEDGLFHDHKLKIAVPGENIFYIETSAGASEKPVPLDRTAFGTYNSTAEAKAYKEDVIDAEVVTETVKRKKK